MSGAVRGTHKAIGRGYLLLADYDSQLIRRESQFVSPPKVKSCEKTAKGKRDRDRLTKQGCEFFH